MVNLGDEYLWVLTSGYRLNRLSTLMVSGYSVTLSNMILSMPVANDGASMIVL